MGIEWIIEIINPEHFEYFEHFDGGLSVGGVAPGA